MITLPSATCHSNHNRSGVKVTRLRLILPGKKLWSHMSFLPRDDTPPCHSAPRLWFNVLPLTLRIFSVVSRPNPTIIMSPSPSSQTTEKKTLLCSACLGDGYQLADCTLCDGRCRLTNSEGDQVECHHCYGTGCESLACSVCSGTGYVPNGSNE